MATTKVEVGRVPASTPPFTLADIRRSVPAHCFEKSTLRSFAHLLADVVVCGLLWWGATLIDSIPSAALRWALWPVYWFAQVCCFGQFTFYVPACMRSEHGSEHGSS